MNPKSIEAPRAFYWELIKRLFNRKAKPSERKMQARVCESIARDVDGISQTKDNFQIDYPVPAPEVGADLPPEAKAKIINDFNAEYQKWMGEDQFCALERKERNFVWTVLFAADWGNEQDAIGMAKIRDAARYLGKSGTLADMEADVPEWTDEDEIEDAEVAEPVGAASE